MDINETIAVIRDYLWRRFESQVDSKSTFDTIMQKLQPFIKKMLDEQPPLHPTAINQFSDLFFQLELGLKNSFTSKDLMPVSLKDPVMIPFEEVQNFNYVGNNLIDQLVVLKLNGGLGTTMGCTFAKSCITIDTEKSWTFLHYIQHQIDSFNKIRQTHIPIWYLNSYKTHRETEKVLGANQFNSLIQNKFPRIDNSLPFQRIPFTYPNEPEEDWNPPGHGDIYTVMEISNWLTDQLKANKKFVFISNSDNLGATPDLGILGLMAARNIDFLMETTPKTEADRKGGSLIYNKNKINLVEIAQIDQSDPEAMDIFQSLPVFNTNNIWISIPKLLELIQDKAIQPTLIQNTKNILEKPVIQLESAMGAAIKSFENAASLVVPRNRFIPVKSTSDLLLLQSDYYIKDEFGIIRIHPERPAAIRDIIPAIKLGRSYQTTSDFHKRIPTVPSMMLVTQLELEGEVWFEPQVKLIGAITIVGNTQQHLLVKSGTTLENIVIENYEIKQNSGRPALIKQVGNCYHVLNEETA